MAKLEFFNCPVKETLALFKGKYALDILTQIFNGTNHYGQLLRVIPEINSRILAQRLREFENEDIVSREILDSNPPMSIRYALTEKGRALEKIVAEMVIWHEKYEADSITKKN
ncbi:MAG: helix-turn-helix transcriptional regulator [Streptococcaceae bacterium]|jgi:DNA-binding HxlR family transcriptional regulator|nr:helix-turn-helix transcriptional regulator [Streptococcaceae bacterium]